MLLFVVVIVVFDNPQVITKMDELTTPYKECTVKIAAGPSGAAFSISAFTFLRPRAPRQWCLWSLFHVYGYLNLTSYKGEPSKWVNMRADEWMARLNK